MWVALQDLTDLGLWNSKMKNRILADKGSVANIPEIPQEVKDIYKTVWELKCVVPLLLPALAAARAALSTLSLCEAGWPTQDRR